MNSLRNQKTIERKITLAKPLLLFSLFWGIQVLLVFAMVVSQEQLMPMIVGYFVSIVFQFSWVFATNRFLLRKLQTHSLTASTWLGLLLVFTVLGMEGGFFLSQTAYSQDTYFWKNILPFFQAGFVLMGVSLYVRLCWRNAKFLLLLIDENRLELPIMLGYFIFFFYWPFGIFFLHNRLKKLQDNGT